MSRHSYQKASGRDNEEEIDFLWAKYFARHPAHVVESVVVRREL